MDIRHPPRGIEDDCAACDGKGDVRVRHPNGNSWQECDVCEGTGMRPYARVRECLDVQDLRLEMLFDDPEEDVA